MERDEYGLFAPQVDCAEILFRWRERAANLSPELRTAKLVQDIDGGSVAVPLPTSAGEHESMSTANFFKIGLEGTAQRHASMQPNLESPSVDPGKKQADERARLRRLAGFAFWEQNGTEINDEQEALRFYAHARAPVMLRPHKQKVDGNPVGIALREPREGLSAYPAPGTAAADVHPPDIIFSFTRTWAWLCRYYPAQAAYLYVGEKQPTGDALFDLVEYVDDEQHTLIVVGRDKNLAPKSKPVLGIWGGVYSGVGKWIVNPEAMEKGTPGRHEACVLRRARNLAEVCTAVMPGRWGLNGRSGLMDGIVGLWFRLQRLSALEDDAIDRGVFPEEWLVNPNGQARVITQADGRAGILGEISEGSIVTRDLNPGYRTTQAIDRLMTYMQMEGHIPAEFLGQNPTGVRTGVRGDALMNAFISFNLASGHRMFQASKARELEIMACIERAYFGNKPKRFYLGWQGAKGRVDYTPNDIFTESTRFVVEYPMVGGDLNMLQQADQMKVGTGTLSRETAMERDPAVKDVPQERSRILSERLNEATMVAIETQAANPNAPLELHDFGRVAEIVIDERIPPYKALQRVQEEVQRRQAEQQQAAPDSPEAQPGIAGVPAPVEQGPPPSLEALLAQATGGVPSAA